MRTRHIPALVIASITATFVAIVNAQQQPPPAQPQQQQPPVFRSGANLVQVDAYPTRDGRIVEGLKAADFEVFEDGKPQAIEQIDFIRIEPNTPDAVRLDPNTQEEGNRLAADPKNRVFVVYLDHYHTNFAGSFRTRQPLVDMLNRLLTANDLFGVMTPLLRPRDLILGRKTETLEEQLARHWTWGTQGSAMLEPDEQFLWGCQQLDIGGDLIGRRRQEKVLDSLDGLVVHLGGLREARKVLLLFTRGWHSYRREVPGGLHSDMPRVGVDPGGRLTTAPPAGNADRARCNAEAMRLGDIETDYRIRELLASANRNNVSFYPINPTGLEAPDTVSGGSMIRQWDDIRDRTQQLLTLAENTDGIAISSNDMAAGLRRIADDVSAYYVLSYYSANTKMDGKYRRIEVKVKAPGLKVKARRGYLAPLDAPADRAASSAATAKGSSSATSGVDEALGTLSRLRPSAELFSYAVATPSDLAIVVELPADRALTGRWVSGADVRVDVTDGSGAAVGNAAARIEPPSRGSLVRVPLPAGSVGPWAVAARVGDGTGALSDRITVTPSRGRLVGGAVLFRARPPATAPLQPAADYQFRRTERMHVDWAVLGALDRRGARVLGRNGAPLALPLTITEREVANQPTLSIDLNLAPLTEADYLIELIVGQGADTETMLVPFRVIR